MRGAVGLEALNSIDFVRRTISAFEDEIALAAWRTTSDRSRLEQFGVHEFCSPTPEFGWAQISFSPHEGDEIAQIAFTSGTTGRPKAIGLTRTNIGNTLSRLRAVMSLDSSVREYIGVPVTYSFGLARARVVSAAGGAFYLPEHGFSPAEIARMLKGGKINAVSAVPTLWRLALQNKDLFGEERKRLKWIETGSQLMTRSEKEGLKSLFPNAAIIQHYGLTEASRTTFLPIHEFDGDALDSVGSATGDVEVRIGEDSRIMIRGPHVARCELTDDGERPLVDSDRWLATNDAGEIRDGRLIYIGRLDDLINCGGVKLDPETLEREISRTLGAKPTQVAVARVADPLRGDAILVALDSRSQIKAESACAAAADAVAAFGVNAVAAISAVTLDSLPVTETGKFKRREIAERALAVVAASPAAGAPAAVDTLERKLIGLWAVALGGKAISADDNYFDLGGDPADDPTAVRALIDNMVAIGVPEKIANGVLDGLSIREIVDQVRMAQNDDPSSAFEEKILSIWRNALGRDDVSVDESFYDIGGDSLSAVTVALNLEKAGLDPKIAQGIFDGRTIRELCRELSATADEEPRRDAVIIRKSEIAMFSEASNFMKGVVLLCMIGSHWFPPFQERFDIYYGPFGRSLAMLYSLGSPTLAFMFGLGVSVFQARQYQKSRKSFNRNYRIALILLAAGVALNGLTELLIALIDSRAISAEGIGSMFYGPFVYFLFATASLPLWIGRIGDGWRSVAGLFAASAAAYAAYGYFAVAGTEFAPENSFRTLALTGRWSLLQMSAISLFGAGVGLLIQRKIQSGGELRSFASLGLAFMAAAFAGTIITGTESTWLRFPKQITIYTMLFYSGLALAVISFFRTVFERASQIPAGWVAISVISSVGILLFPLFVLQSFVYRGASILNRFSGNDFLIDLSVMITCFAIVAAALVARVRKIYYSSR